MKRLIIGLCLFALVGLVGLVGCSKHELTNAPLHDAYKIGEKIEFVLDGRIGQIIGVQTLYGAEARYRYNIETTAHKTYKGRYPYVTMIYVDEYEIRKVEATNED